jgi:hypothetical protein
VTGVLPRRISWADLRGLGRLVPNVYFGKGGAILDERERIGRQPIQWRHLLHQSRAA